MAMLTQSTHLLSHPPFPKWFKTSPSLSLLRGMDTKQAPKKKNSNQKSIKKETTNTKAFQQLRPGIANFSGLFQQSGWLPPTLTILLCVVCSIASGKSCQSILISANPTCPFSLTSDSPNIGRFTKHRLEKWIMDGRFKIS